MADTAPACLPIRADRRRLLLLLEATLTESEVTRLDEDMTTVFFTTPGPTLSLVAGTGKGN